MMKSAHLRRKKKWKQASVLENLFILTVVCYDCFSTSDWIFNLLQYVLDILISWKSYFFWHVNDKHSRQRTKLRMWVLLLWWASEVWANERNRLGLGWPGGAVPALRAASCPPPSLLSTIFARIAQPAAVPSTSRHPTPKPTSPSMHSDLCREGARPLPARHPVMHRGRHLYLGIERLSQNHFCDSIMWTVIITW